MFSSCLLLRLDTSFAPPCLSVQSKFISPPPSHLKSTRPTPSVFLLLSLFTFAHTIVRAMPSDPLPTVRVVHFNDVYNIDEAPREPKGGAARFVTAIRQTIQCHNGPSLVLFSGDAFSPAPLTPYTKGAEVPPILNAVSTDVACIGNHELDNGIEIMKERISETNFPWLISNIFHRESTETVQISPSLIPHHKPLAGLQMVHTLTRGGIKFGFVGLASMEWLSCLDKVSLDDVAYVDFCEAADYFAGKLKSEHDCDFVIALTHMREPDDYLLASTSTAVDLILGGHDHIQAKKFINGKWVLKSGTDFKNFATIDIVPTNEGDIIVQEPVHFDVDSEYVPDPDISDFVEEQLSLLGDRNAPALAICDVELDGRFVSIRTQETALGNFAADVLAKHMGTNLAFINAGTFRSDMMEPAGVITSRTIKSILPFQDVILRVKMSGNEIIRLLERSVSDYPLLAGKFCQVSGIEFEFDGTGKPNERIDMDTLLCKDDDGLMKPVVREKMYEMALKMFVFMGKDGFAGGSVENILEKSPMTLREIMIEHLKSVSKNEKDGMAVIAPTIEGRVRCRNPDRELQKRYFY